jgi:hypothetical protein
MAGESMWQFQVHMGIPHRTSVCFPISLYQKYQVWEWQWSTSCCISEFVSCGECMY